MSCRMGWLFSLEVVTEKAKIVMYWEKCWVLGEVWMEIVQDRLVVGRSRRVGGGEQGVAVRAGDDGGDVVGVVEMFDVDVVEEAPLVSLFSSVAVVAVGLSVDLRDNRSNLSAT